MRQILHTRPWQAIVLASVLAALAAAPACAAPLAPAFPLKLGVDGRTLVDARGRPFFLQGDTPWSLTHNLTFEESVRYMEDRRAQGFNTLLVSVPDAYDPEGKATYPPDRYGHPAFESDADWTRPVEAYWANVDRVFRKAEELGFLLLVAPAYLGCCNDGYLEQLKRNGPEKLRAYGRWIGRRYASLSNVVWVHGGDRGPFEVEDEVRAVARGIHEGDPGHLHTAHWASNGSALDHFADEGWLDFNASYTYGPVAWRVLYDRLRHPEVPTFLIETHYEDDFGKRTADDTRGYPYRAVLAGAMGHLFGSKPLWYCGRGWQEALDKPGSRYMGHVRTLFESRAWWELEPDVAHRFVVEGHGDPGADDGVQAAVTSGRDTLVAYLPSRRTIRVALGELRGPSLAGFWFDPRTGASTAIPPCPRTGTRAFEPPAEGDWVLVLDDASRGRPAPGTYNRRNAE
jgi:hypothetical protein